MLKQMRTLTALTLATVWITSVFVTKPATATPTEHRYYPYTIIKVCETDPNIIVGVAEALEYYSSWAYHPDNECRWVFECIDQDGDGDVDLCWWSYPCAWHGDHKVSTYWAPVATKIERVSVRDHPVCR